MKKIVTIGIYKITSPSGKIYIGQGVNIEHRWECYKGLHCKTQTKLYNSFLKHGVENHNFEIIHTCKEEELNDLEIYYINFYNTFNTEHGLNLREGGNSGGRLSDETKKKQSEAKIGKPQSIESVQKRIKSNTGKKRSKEFVMRFSGENNPSYGKRGKDSPNYKKIHSKETILRMCKAQSNRSEETIKKSSESKMGEKNPNYGKSPSVDTRKKLSDSVKLYWENIRQERLTMTF